MKLLLDTNVISKMIRGREPAYRLNAQRSLQAGDEHTTSVIVVHELEYGALKSPDEEKTRRRYKLALSHLSEIYPFTDDDALTAAKLRMLLDQRGEGIGEYDTLIAAQAMRTGTVLVTNNTRRFARIAGLVMLDWSKF